MTPTAVEEIVRWATPVINFRRTASRDAVVGGQEIKAGDKVVMFYNSANRDERQFPDPYRFDVTRTPNEHVGFGAGGPHFCLGANLARREVGVMFEELFRKLARHPHDDRARPPAERLHPRHQAPALRIHRARQGWADAVTAPLPLPTLLSQALVAFTIELDSQFELKQPTGTWLTSYVMWANFLQYVEGGGTTYGELQERACVTKEQLHVMSGGMARWGYVTVSPGATKAKADQRVVMTFPGRTAQDLWRPLAEAIEVRWRDRFGAEPVAALRTALHEFVDQVDARCRSSCRSRATRPRSSSKSLMTRAHRRRRRRTRW